MSSQSSGCSDGESGAADMAHDDAASSSTTASESEVEVVKQSYSAAEVQALIDAAVAAASASAAATTAEQVGDMQVELEQQSHLIGFLQAENAKLKAQCAQAHTIDARQGLMLAQVKTECNSFALTSMDRSNGGGATFHVQVDSNDTMRRWMSFINGVYI